MTTNPATTARLHAQADADANKAVTELNIGLVEVRHAVWTEIRNAYLRGAEAGYLARLSEELSRP